MGNLNDPKERQRFLQEAINEQLNQRKQLAQKTGVMSDTKFVGKLVDFFDNKEEKAYRQLSKRFGLWGNGNRQVG
ncbi:hypothetical protein BH09BAC1_BH09BAC1_08740 [soil metagenome]